MPEQQHRDAAAMLSDGEFVMNAKAVRGAGGGDGKQGAKRMYQMIEKFEKGSIMAETQTVIQREAPEIEAYKLGLMEQAKH